MNRSDQTSGAPIDVGIGLVLQDRFPGQKTGVGHSLSTLRFLITRRPKNTVYGGYWELPGGKAEHSEHFEACVLRELQEEVGLAVRVIHNLPVVCHAYAHGSVQLHPCVCLRVDSAQEPEARAVADARWISLHELPDYRFPEANDLVFGHFRDWANDVIKGC